MANWEEFENPRFVPDRTIRPVSKEEREFRERARRDGVPNSSYKEYKESVQRLAKISSVLARLGGASDSEDRYYASAANQLRAQQTAQFQNAAARKLASLSQYEPSPGEYLFYDNGGGRSKLAANETNGSTPTKATPKTTQKKLKPAATKISGDSYTVKYGDTLSKIAKRAGMTVKELAEINQIADVNKIFAGDKIKLKNTATKNAVKRALAEQVRKAAENAAYENDSAALAELANQVPETATQQMTSPGRVFNLQQDTPFDHPSAYQGVNDVQDYAAGQGYDQSMGQTQTNYNYGAGLEWLNQFNDLSNRLPYEQPTPYMGYNSTL